ncbi:hypothetical protein SAMD00019534_072870 [Acytostelium subglobosum LB1]|uniref:hypothetical protein n=1 Tax=Acytostelium subglobosum LB1 TaxID=1410327 RepID=UPI000644ED37|nr:hypothetical protein SAMD00019534_072870 [Acytostelium subglobosum LB1]GAM24112.1 hypothetical protein SAMD00019534_072870 [Acytostelium subglobosum LB1]|eukprot:XP_012753148.1 hypothetical protein SAMD00019534_072870 [Acytostelium subglobosum LB1]
MTSITHDAALTQSGLSKNRLTHRTQLSSDRVDKKYNDIIDMILSPQMELMNVLCSINLVVKESSREFNSTANLSDVLVNFWEIHSSQRSIHLVKWAIDKEVESTSNSATLFRGLSTATRLISSCYKRMGDTYLKYLLQPFVLDLCSRNFSFEIDPDKAGKGMDVKSNLERLITITQQLLDKILDSASVCPASIKTIMGHIQQRVEKKFPEMKTTVIGGFMFLRFICPAIVAPEVFGLIQNTPTVESRRGLVLVSKLLQNLANEMPFGGIKEEYMIYLNEFISSNSAKINVYFNELAYENNANNTFNIANGNSNTNGNTNGTATTTTTQHTATLNGANRYRSRSESPPLKPVGSTQKLINVNNLTHQQPEYYADEQILENLTALIGNLFEYREKIESTLADVHGPDMAKRFDAALTPLHKLHQKAQLSLNSSNKVSKKKSPISTLANGSLHKKKSGNKDVAPISIVPQSEVEEELTNQLNRSLYDIVNHYRHQLDLKDLELRAQQDEMDVVMKELEESKSRSNILKKLREEFDSERKRRKEAESQLKKALEKLKSLGQEVTTDLVMLPDEESYSDLSNIPQEEETTKRRPKPPSFVRKSESTTSLCSLGPTSPTNTSAHYSNIHNDTISLGSANGGASGIDTDNQKSVRPCVSRSDSASELSSESVMFDNETEDRIIQACVDGEVEEDDNGMDLLEFLKEYGERVEAANKQSVAAQKEEKEERRKRTSGLFRHMPSLKIGGKKKSNSNANLVSATTPPKYPQNSSSSSSSD